MDGGDEAGDVAKTRSHFDGVPKKDQGKAPRVSDQSTLPERCQNARPCAGTGRGSRRGEQK
jgi:hypothetical protein